MGVSSKTLCRRAADWGIEAYSATTDAELDEKVSVIKHRFPNCKEVMMNGHLVTEHCKNKCVEITHAT